MNDVALPLRLWVALSPRLDQSQTAVRDEQPNSRQPSLLHVTKKGRPARLVVLRPSATPSSSPNPSALTPMPTRSRAANVTRPSVISCTPPRCAAYAAGHVLGTGSAETPVPDRAYTRSLNTKSKHEA